MKYLFCNALTLGPRRVMMIKGAHKMVKALKEEKVDVMEVPYDEGYEVHCTTLQLIMDERPRLFE